MWPSRLLALHVRRLGKVGTATLGHHKDIPPGATVSLCVSLQPEAAYIEYLAFVF